MHSSAAVRANIFFQGVVTAFLALTQKPNHYFSPLKEHGPTALAICVIHPYSRTACTSPLNLAFPPVGSASTALQTLQVTLFTALLKISCSLPHLGHLIRRNVLLGLGISLFHSLIILISPFNYPITSFLRRIPSLCLMKLQILHLSLRVCFLVVLANSFCRGYFCPP